MQVKNLIHSNYNLINEDLLKTKLFDNEINE